MSTGAAGGEATVGVEAGVGRKVGADEEAGAGRLYVLARVNSSTMTQEQRPCGLVLESPFNNIFDEVRADLMLQLLLLLFLLLLLLLLLLPPDQEPPLWLVVEEDALV